MTYIEQLQNDKKLLVEFFNAFNDLETKETKLENTAYRGDALRAANAARAHLNAVRAKVNEMIARKTNKEAVNA